MYVRKGQASLNYLVYHGAKVKFKCEAEDFCVTETQTSNLFVQTLRN